MSRFPSVSGRLMVQFLESRGFRQSRRHGSHVFLRHPDGRTATVPVHSSEDLGRGLISKILKDAEVTREAFLTWLTKKKG